MTKHSKIPASDEAWGNGELGRDAEHAKQAGEDIESQIDEALELTSENTDGYIMPRGASLLPVV